MEASQHYAYTALALAAGKVAFGWGSYWWNKRSIREKYISHAFEIQTTHELVTEDQTDELFVHLEPAENTFTEKPEIAIRRRKGVFRNYLVRMGQAKFGCPSRNEANRLVVRKYLYDLCIDHKLLARHICSHLDVATELVFVPSTDQLTAAAVRHTRLSKVRLEIMQDLAGPRPAVA